LNLYYRNEAVGAQDENFWTQAYKLQCKAPARGDNETKETRANCTQAAKGESNRLEEKSVAPGFLVPVLQQVIVAGKSMQMLHSLGRLKQATKTG